MFTSILIASVLACAPQQAGPVLTAQVPDGREGFDFKGTIMQAGDQQLVLKMGEMQFNFIVPDKTRVLLDGVPAELSKLKPGYQAMVQAKKVGDEYLATTITARSTVMGKGPVDPVVDPVVDVADR